jgi:hypothetical protein
VHNAPRSPDNRARKPPAMGEAPPLCWERPTWVRIWGGFLLNPGSIYTGLTCSPRQRQISISSFYSYAAGPHTRLESALFTYLLLTGLAFTSNVYSTPHSTDNRARKPPAMGEVLHQQQGSQTPSNGWSAPRSAESAPFGCAWARDENEDDAFTYNDL